MWLTEKEREGRVFQGIQSENLRKLRSGITVAGASDEEKVLKKVFQKKYKIPLDFELFSSHAPFYKFPIEEDIVFELEFAPVNDVIVTGTPANMNYKLENICLEYDTVTNKMIADEMISKYQSGFGILYDWIDKFKIVDITAAETLINENINFPIRSLKGVLLLFISDYDSGKRDSEKFENHNITNIEVTIEGISNRIFPRGMRMIDQWEEIKKHFMRVDILL